MSHVPAAPDPAHVSRVPRTLLDRVAQWWRTSTLTLWAVAGAAGLFQLMVLSSTVGIVVAKDLMIVPSQVTKVRMTHIPSATTAKRGR